MINRFRISTRLIAGLGTIGVLMLGVGASGLISIRGIEQTLNRITDVSGPTVETADDLRANIWEATKVTQEIIAEDVVADIDALIAEFRALDAAFDETYRELTALVSDPDLLDEMELAFSEQVEFVEHSEEMFAAHSDELYEARKAAELLAEFDAVGAEIKIALDEFATENEAEMAFAEEEGDRIEGAGGTAAEVNAVLGELFDQDYPVVEAALKLQAIVLELQDTAGEYLAETNAGALAAIDADFSRILEQSTGHVAVLEQLAETEEDRRDVENIRGLMEAWRALAKDDERLFDSHRDRLVAKSLAEDLTEVLESDADNVAAALDVVATVADGINSSADEAAAAAVSTALLIIGGLILAALLIALGMIVMVVATITRPISQMTGAMRSLAGGKAETEIPGLDRGDEIGDMAGAVQVFKDNMARNAELTRAAAEEQAAREARAKTVESLTAEFDSMVSGMLENVGSAVDRLGATAGTMTDIATHADEQATSVASAAEQATANVETVSAASEELSSSIAEISRQVAQSTDIAVQAVQDAEETNERVRALEEGAERIGTVVSLITSIAEQTNLLALNATIEAARAGDAGKGFAVVASEVKGLATQTAKATEEIAGQIQAIQTSTGDAAQAIEKISERIREMANISSGIAAAVERQNAATREISRNVQEAATGTRQVGNSIVSVSQASRQTGAAAVEVNKASDELSSQSEQLQGFVQRFLGGIRAA